MNKPRVDWIRIIWKCQNRFGYNSKADLFATEQCLKHGVAELLESQHLNATGQLGHKSPRRPKVHYYEPTDLNCDDPYYDGVPVI